MPTIIDRELKNQIRKAAWKAIQRAKSGVGKPTSRQVIERMIESCQNCGYDKYAKSLQAILDEINRAIQDRIADQEHIRQLIAAGGKIGSKALYYRNNYTDKRGGYSKETLFS